MTMNFVWSCLNQWSTWQLAQTFCCRGEGTSKKIMDFFPTFFVVFVFVDDNNDMERLYNLEFVWLDGDGCIWFFKFIGMGCGSAKQRIFLKVRY